MPYVRGLTHTHERARKQKQTLQHWRTAPAGLTRTRLAHILTHISQQLRIIYANRPAAFLAFHYYYLSVIGFQLQISVAVHAIRIHISYFAVVSIDITQLNANKHSYNVCISACLYVCANAWTQAKAEAILR